MHKYYTLKNGRTGFHSIRGTNCIEAYNKVLEDLLPATGCGRKYARAIVQLHTTGYNLRTGIKYLGWSDLGCTNLPLLIAVHYSTFQTDHLNIH